MNRVLLTGRITKDPEVRYSQNGMATLRFTIAVDRQQRDASGNRVADFISCVAFGQNADFISHYVHKGNMLAVEGRIQTGQFQGQDGQMRYTTDVVVDRCENLSPRDPNQPMQQSGMAQAQPQYQNQGYQAQPNYGANQGYANPSYGQAQRQEPQSFDVPVADDDLPF